ncbi:molybdopterin molybdenumtransferase MoeA [Paractinoplanes abujensis]|uniref:Molybdopterin molybdenumtransferase n=1 Tax=Paractinoplanes abujensis TaxID=882441 RepID=A0A7W7CSJ4_9ACTN|nr:molybdopterin molybdotransferase MoeA [Actinoplanes abujensis]MBB4693544.1 molybdopterin molybdotransferase [Actinoplanes abujensis]GID21796.1 molybdopterin molybdenumtransferase MoeA [Actinoplanes abujensis]
MTAGTRAPRLDLPAAMTPAEPSACLRHTGAALSWHQARARAHRLGRAEPLGTEQLSVHHGAGRTLAEAVHALVMLPGFDNAAMDGYAVRGVGPWKVIGRVLAGECAPRRLGSGEAMEIATGAAVPEGTDRVVEYEAAVRGGDIVDASTSGRDHVRRRGQYVTTGQCVLPAGHPLTPAALGLAASVGADIVTVRRQSTARILITGDEIVDSGVPSHGKVRDAISPVLSALLKNWNVTVDGVRVDDRPAEALTAAVDDALDRYDITIVCGSSSVGPADGLHDTVTAVGALTHVDGVACRPGHPQLLAQRGRHWLVGVPGNPFAAVVAAVTIIEPLLTGLNGRDLSVLPSADLQGTVRAAPQATRLVPVHLRGQQAHVIEGAHPGYLGPAAYADALAVIPPGWNHEAVDLLSLTG